MAGFQRRASSLPLALSPQPVRCIQTGGIIIMLGAPTQRALPAGTAMPVLDLEPADEH
jgi:hypothetical protein